MELKNLTSKLEKIPFENWNRERNISKWNNYSTKIKNHKIVLGILYPQHYLDDTKIELNVYSPKKDILIDGICTPKICEIATKLEKVYEEKEKIKNYKNIKKKNSKLNSFLKYLSH